MKVSQIPYQRITLEAMTESLTEIIEQVKSAADISQVLAAREKYNELFTEFYTAASLAHMRYTINTVDEFYIAEMEHYDEITPSIESLNLNYINAMLESPFRAELEKELSPVIFKSYEVQAKAISPEIVEDMVEENKLTMEYSKLMASMEFEFRGEKMPRAMLMKYAKDDDREVRKECYEVLGRGLAEHSQQLDDIFDRLVHVRDRMAKKMGYKNFVELGYYRMGRLCYDETMVKQFRQNVLADITPVVSRLKTENGKNLGIDRLMLYDDGVICKGGDPKPGTKDEIFAAGKEMYREMSPETDAFFTMMLENEAFDVESRMNKWGGGYCTSFPKYQQPFILANFNGTAGDVDVVTHEAGHAFADYMNCGNRFYTELNVGPMETAEVHSMSMECFAWKYMDKFFGDDAGKYRYMHAMDNISFIPYGVIVDEFQHIVYENPDMTPAQRKEAYLELEKKYRPYLSVEGIPYLEEGTRWQYQMHIYETPFYYIDYCLAQVTALQFLLLSQKDYDDAFARYFRFLSTGGEKVFTDLLKDAGLNSPFEDGALSGVAKDMEALIEKIRV